MTHLTKFKGNPTRPKLAASITTYEVQDEVEAIYANNQVKRQNTQIRREAREAEKRRGISLAVMPWDLHEQAD